VKWVVEIGDEFDPEFEKIIMARNVRQVIKGLSPARRKKIEARAAALIAEEMSLRDLRQALKLTQERIAKTLDIGQDGVSRLEKRSDLLISTLRSYVEAMGGRLFLVVEFPDREPVLLSGIASLAAQPAPTRRKSTLASTTA
jgi:DNA-binding XRE family transcriptional regulator